MTAGEIRTRQELLDVRTSLTARQAFAAVLPEVRKIDGTFKFLAASSGEDINHLGQASTWNFIFTFSRLRAHGGFTIEPCSGIEGAGPGPGCLAIHIKTMDREFVGDKGQRPPDERAFVRWLQRSWDERDRVTVGLPLEFRDSPEAVEALARQGADWIAGGIHMTLSSKVLPNDEIVWITDHHGQELRTPFARIK